MAWRCVVLLLVGIDDRKLEHRVRLDKRLQLRHLGSANLECLRGCVRQIRPLWVVNSRGPRVRSFQAYSVWALKVHPKTFEQSISPRRRSQH